MTDTAPGPPSIVLSVTEIRRRPGSRLPVDVAMPAGGLALADARVPDGAEMTLRGEIESIHEGVVLTAVAEVPWVGSCRRCLGDVSGLAVLDVREVWETKPTDGETWPLVQDQVDVGPLLHDTALLALPLAPLCSQDCLGPAPDAFPATVETERAEGDEPPKDPRWAALDDLDLG